MGVRLTKEQSKRRQQIEAWLAGRPFQEYARSKPEVPVLYRAQIFEWYVPHNIIDGGQFHTPLETGRHAIMENLYIPPGAKVLEPCAGIGMLLENIYLFQPEAEVEICELDIEQADIVQRLYPKARFIGSTPFEHYDEIEGQYDLVVMNPPYGSQWGLQAAIQKSQTGTRKSEYLFLELAIRALKPEGRALVIATDTYLENFPKPFARWMETRARLHHQSDDYLPGQFKFTNVNVKAYVFERLAEPVQIAPPEPVQVAQTEPVQVAQTGQATQLKLF